MRAALLCALGAASLLASLPARAGEATVVPTLVLSGDTSGKGKIVAGADFAATRGTWDVFLSPSFSVANDGGSAAILTYTKKDGNVGPTQFSGSLSVTFARSHDKALAFTDQQNEELLGGTRLCIAHMGTQGALGDEPDAIKAWLGEAAEGLLTTTTPTDPSAQQELRAEAVKRLQKAHPGCTIGAAPGVSCTCAPPNAACTRAQVIAAATEALQERSISCNPKNSDNQFGALCTWLAKQMAAPTISLTPDKLCKAGGMLHKAADAKLKELRKLLYPEHLVAIGATYSAASFKYLESTAGNLESSGGTRSSVAGHVLYTYVRPVEKNRFTLELPVSFESSWKESTSTAYQCTPKGTLDGKSVQDCSTSPLGPPTKSYLLSGAAMLGIAGIDEKDTWRIAIGPAFNVDFASTAATTWQIGGQLPFYASLTKAAGYGQEYEGMVRIMPSVVAERVLDDKTNTYQVGARATLSVALLGKRKMFGSSLYWP
ncbi:MAG: hypothetical protein QM820_04730 [Minicystis sp.]